ncbi:MAG: hypothetical protein L0287_16545 [Anaerolineae bacterium]|nr:hypothetical protein [Anaerolineae bacterium]
MAEKFIKMTKDGETIEVSPLVVEDHKRLGWKEVTPKGEVGAQAKAAAKKTEAEAEAEGNK